MDVANEILDAIEIIVDKKIRENTVQIYPGVCKSVSGNTCTMSINGRDNTVQFYGSTPTVGTIYRVFVPNGNMSMAFIIAINDDSSFAKSASIFVTGLSEIDTVTASKDGKTVVGKWTKILNPVIVVPDGYTQLEYLQSTGTQYIVTGLNSTTRYDHEITFSDYAYAKTQGILGSSGYYYSYTGYNNTLRWCMSDRAYDTPGSLTSKRTAKLGYNYLTVDGSSVSQTSDTNGTPSDTTHTLFKGYNCASVKIYSYRASLDGQLLRDFVPCKRNSDDELGMYDLVNDVFYTNEGTGAFTAGAEVPHTIDGFLIDKIKDYGTWTVTATNETNTATHDVLVDSAMQYEIEMSYTL